MCGRFNLLDEYDYVAQLFNSRTALQFPARYNIAPGQPVVIIKNQIDVPESQKNRPDMQLVQWGFVADWMKAPPARLILNARAETVLYKPMFRGAIEQNRCIIPASGWYEWKTIKGVKQPFYLRRDMSKSNNSLMGFAGIYSRFMAADGSEIDTMAILTREAVGHVRQVHHRMPCILPQDGFDEWLNGWDVRGRNAIKLCDDENALKQVESIKLYPVSRDVGNSRIDKPYFIDEIELEDAKDMPQKPQDQLSLF
ncbi:MAG: SOS response-associated peptidase [Rhizobiales bacterium]|nr:SOS response-associated peptidase [Hyphomicrobiales bacterium]NRB13447.1 SOS response-associated peptidase [Hyphomicrobiales bacterium]